MSTGGGSRPPPPVPPALREVPFLPRPLRGAPPPPPGGSDSIGRVEGGGGEAVVDRGLELAREAGVLEHQAVRVDDAAVELGEPLREPLLQVLELGYGFLERALQAPLLLLGMVGARLVDQPEADRRLEEVRLAAAEAGCGGGAREPRPAAPRRRPRPGGGLLPGPQAPDGRHPPAARVPPPVLPSLHVL